MKILFEVEAIDGSRYNIGYDKRCYIVQEWRVPGPDAKGEPGWKHAKSPYCGSLASACLRLLEMGLANTTAASLSELVGQVALWGERIEEAAHRTASRTCAPVIGGAPAGDPDYERQAEVFRTAMGKLDKTQMLERLHAAGVLEPEPVVAVPSWLNPAVLTRPDK